MRNDFLKYKHDGKRGMLLWKFDLWDNCLCYWPWTCEKFVVSSLKQLHFFQQAEKKEALLFFSILKRM